ncbi:Dyp-type peroxidase [Rubrivivax sp. RP6-9]|uniref:Dyp-type peroxidase n=1 Tax=Rubrivivax sp. RP6-9 TaxID=3415750 RepID=UPI003CC67191
MTVSFGSTQLRGITNLAVLAPVRDGFVPGFESISYVERLHRLLKALNNARLYTREAAPARSPFADTIGRFGIIHSFRYAITPRYGEGASGEGPHQLSLNVTFDGGWEPYMRVIYRDIGPLLDALFCHNPDYPGSRSSSFAEYSAWVRRNELSDGLFYADSAMTLGDKAYLEELERVQRESRDPRAADRAIAGLSVAAQAEVARRALQEARRDPLTAAAVSLRTLKGLYRLAAMFPANTRRDDLVLLRFAHSLLQEFRTLDGEGLFLDPRLAPLQQAFRDELAWFRQPDTVPPVPAPPAFTPKLPQGGIVQGYAGMTHGALVLMQVTDAAAARRWLKKLALSRDGEAPVGGVARNLACTYAGLQALGVHAQWLDALPQEFADGMEARAGLLGDVRGNHPDNWQRPLRNWPPVVPPRTDQVDLSTVHLVLVLRLADAGTDSPDLHPELAAEVQQAAAAGTGVAVLSVQPMRSWRQPLPGPVPGGSVARGHFGFVDGLSQPLPQRLVPGQPRGPDAVPLGEVLLGHPNDRDDPRRLPPPNALLDNGSFLVVRKLRQRVDVLDRVLDQQTRQLAPNSAAAHALQRPLLETMMGRRQDGSALVLPPGDLRNDFDYQADPQGRACPFQSHVRRMHPRDGRPYTPRVVRRGMSYGPQVRSPLDLEAERGLVFMAYCASIAEQFELLQRWVAGGNSSGVSSAQADPLLGVPEPGERRTFRFVDAQGEVQRVDLGDQAFVALQWGLYLFAPSLKAVRALDKFTAPPPVPRTVAGPVGARAGTRAGTRGGAPAGASASAPAEDPEIAAWRERLDAPTAERADAPWRVVRDVHGGAQATAFGLLVGGASQVQQVLQDDGRRFSVAGYGDRMTQSIGAGYLGVDAHVATAERQVADVVNPLIEAVSEAEAFMAARKTAEAVLARFIQLTQALPSEGGKVAVDLLSLSENVLAALCTRWFGLPEPVPPNPPTPPLMVPGGRSASGAALPARCPGHLLTTSRYVFSPHPNDTVAQQGPEQGAAVREAFAALLRQPQPPLGRLGTAIRDALDQAALPGAAPDLLERTLAGTMLGFPPTVHGNFVRVVGRWIDDRSLWTLQQQLADARAAQAAPAPPPADPQAAAQARLQAALQRAQAVLGTPLLQTMARRPVPEMVWRTAAPGASVGGEAPTDPARRVVVGLASALADGGDPMLMFGGDRRAGTPPPHACPGYAMATGVLLGVLSALLEAGTLRPTGSAIQLTLIPPAN